MTYYPTLANGTREWGTHFMEESTKMTTPKWERMGHPADPSWHPGEGFRPRLFTPISDSAFAIVFNGRPGVIGYCVITRNELLGAAAVLLALAEIGNIAGEEEPEIERGLEHPEEEPIPIPVAARTTILGVAMAEESLEFAVAAIPF